MGLLASHLTGPCSSLLVSQIEIASALAVSQSPNSQTNKLEMYNVHGFFFFSFVKFQNLLNRKESSVLGPETAASP